MLKTLWACLLLKTSFSFPAIIHSPEFTEDCYCYEIIPLSSTFLALTGFCSEAYIVALETSTQLSLGTSFDAFLSFRCIMNPLNQNELYCLLLAEFDIFLGSFGLDIMQFGTLYELGTSGLDFEKSSSFLKDQGRLSLAVNDSSLYVGIENLNGNQKSVLASFDPSSEFTL